MLGELIRRYFRNWLKPIINQKWVNFINISHRIVYHYFRTMRASASPCPMIIAISSKDMQQIYICSLKSNIQSFLFNFSNEKNISLVSICFLVCPHNICKAEKAALNCPQCKIKYFRLLI